MRSVVTNCYRSTLKLCLSQSKLLNPLSLKPQFHSHSSIAPSHFPSADKHTLPFLMLIWVSFKDNNSVCLGLDLLQEILSLLSSSGHFVVKLKRCYFLEPFLVLNFSPNSLVSFCKVSSKYFLFRCWFSTLPCHQREGKEAHIFFMYRSVPLCTLQFAVDF
jgi:hypothetical protein